MYSVQLSTMFFDTIKNFPSKAMSKVTYYVGASKYSSDSKLQLKGTQLIAVEENLNYEIKMDILKNEVPQYGLHDISLWMTMEYLHAQKIFQK